ncbi:MAG TPA: AbrB family transcriptional regulator [Xanthobacteraceae bacterium]|nr:AbrB family transcriptional regulator [Xanthobacteraceae bacterium]
MPFSPPPLRTVIEVAETLAIALAGGLAFALLQLPAGLVSGSVMAVAAAALLGRPVKLPLGLARVCYVIVGILLGTVVTPETLHGVAAWPESIALLMVASVAMIMATSIYLRVIHRWDPLSALMGASPGSMAQVIALSTELGGDLRAIAIVQTVRVLLLVLGLPNGLALFGLVVPAVAPVRGPAGMAVLGEMMLLVAVATVFAAAFHRLRFPGGLLFGAMAGSAILHGSGTIDAALPWWIGSSAVIVLGGLVGSRFANTTARMLFGFLGAAFGSFAVSMAVATSFVLMVIHYYPFPVANVAIAYAPGAQDTMMVLALALHLDPVYVGAHHLARFLVVTFAVAVGARRMAKRKLPQREET